MLARGGSPTFAWAVWPYDLLKVTAVILRWSLTVYEDVNHLASNIFSCDMERQANIQYVLNVVNTRFGLAAALACSITGGFASRRFGFSQLYM
jgi:hypothetical protein